jgi:thioredoxin 1
MLGPVMERVNATIPVQKVNIEEQSALAQQYNVRSIPTVVLLENGNEIKRIVGAKSESEYLNV